MRIPLLILALAICFSCASKKEEDKTSSQNEYSVFYRALNTKNSWVITPGGIIFDKTEVLVLDSSGAGYQFTDTARSYNINDISELRLERLKNCRNALSIKNAGFNKLNKKQLTNGESYFVMSSDTNYIFVYKILKDSANFSYTCEMYGSHSSDSTDSRYAFHGKESEIFTFRKYK